MRLSSESPGLPKTVPSRLGDPIEFFRTAHYYRLRRILGGRYHAARFCFYFHDNRAIQGIIWGYKMRRVWQLNSRQWPSKVECLFPGLAVNRNKKADWTRQSASIRIFSLHREHFLHDRNRCRTNEHYKNSGENEYHERE